jgi:hypothetical protein
VPHRCFGKLAISLLCLLFAFPSFGRGFVNPKTLEALEPVVRNRVLYFSSLGETAMGLATVNFGYEFDPEWRFDFGLGFMFGASGGVGIKYRMLSPEEELRPFVGVLIGGLFSNSSGSFSNALAGKPAFGNWSLHLGTGANVGLDWKFPSGMYIGVGVTAWYWDTKETVLAPFFNFGYFFRSKSSLTEFR